MKKRLHAGETVRPPRYNETAVDRAIASSNRSGRKISSRESSAIHRLLKGRTVKSNPLSRKDYAMIADVLKQVRKMTIDEGYTSTLTFKDGVFFAITNARMLFAERLAADNPHFDKLKFSRATLDN